MIVVDNLIKWPMKGKSAQVRRVFADGSCHLTSDTSLEELHEFAERIGLKRRWFQGGRHPHYDLNASKRALAVASGAHEVDRRGLVAAFRRLRGDR